MSQNFLLLFLFFHITVADYYYFVMETTVNEEEKGKFLYDSLQVVRMYSSSKDRNFATRLFQFVNSDPVKNEVMGEPGWLALKHKNALVEVTSGKEDIPCYDTLPSPTISYNGYRLDISSVFVGYCYHQVGNELPRYSYIMAQARIEGEVELVFGSGRGDVVLPSIKVAIPAQVGLKITITDQFDKAKELASQSSFSLQQKNALPKEKRYRLFSQFGKYVLDKEVDLPAQTPDFLVYVWVDHTPAYKVLKPQLKENQKYELDFTVPCEIRRVIYHAFPVAMAEYSTIYVRALVVCKRKELRI